MARTTVEIPTRDLAALRALAARRGLRGFTGLVAEAVHEYLAATAARERAERRRLKAMRHLRGSISKEAARRMHAVVEADRKDKA